jgi:hypothetical protein
MTTKFISENDIDLGTISENPLFEDEKDSSSEKILDDEKINKKIMNIFHNKSFPLDEYYINRDDLYILPNKKSPAEKKCDFFKVTKSTTQFTKKKRGKQPKLKKNKKKIHDKYSHDNELAKVKNHSLSSVPPFLNDILKVMSIKEKFYQLSHKFKKKIQNNYFSEAKKETLGNIICNKISPKYRRHDKNENIKTFDKVKDHEIFKKILSMDYITYFKRYYMESKKCINLKDYGLENEIILSEKCKMYNDLIKKNTNNEDNENYIKSIKNCIKKNYITKTLFKTHK